MVTVSSWCRFFGVEYGRDTVDDAADTNSGQKYSGLGSGTGGCKKVSVPFLSFLSERFQAAWRGFGAGDSCREPGSCSDIRPRTRKYSASM